DLEVTTTLMNLLEDMKPKEFSRYKRLVDIINSKEYGWTVKESKDRIVIFTERIETLKFLYENLQKDLNLKSENIAMMHGSMNDIELQKIVDDFGREESKLRILVASDVASEGINLHYLSHRLIHFDIPWSLMVFQQRNGRIDRYGQENTPDIRYLITDTNNEKIKGDMRILEVLTIKEEQATKNIGDPAALMNVYDSQEEEKITARAMNSNMSAEEFNNLLTPDEDLEFDFMSLLMSEEDEDTVSTSDKQTESLKTLFTDID
ncbi:SWF/SNF helicase family protein, partial [Clostridium saudiense]|nr:SWF/SNF helicase family protein [Clostridium saudiense]